MPPLALSSQMHPVKPIMKPLRTYSTSSARPPVKQCTHTLNHPTDQHLIPDSSTSSARRSRTKLPAPFDFGVPVEDSEKARMRFSFVAEERFAALRCKLEMGVKYGFLNIGWGEVPIEVQPRLAHCHTPRFVQQPFGNCHPITDTFFCIVWVRPSCAEELTRFLESFCEP